MPRRVRMTDDQFQAIMKELRLIAYGVGAVLGILIVLAWHALK
jgi:hypothetical protein